MQGDFPGAIEFGLTLRLKNVSIKGVFKMQGAYCLTVLEAAEMAGIRIEEMMQIAANETGVAVKAGDAWRVDFDALGAALAGRSGMRKAA